MQQPTSPLAKQSGSSEPHKLLELLKNFPANTQLSDEDPKYLAWLELIVRSCTKEALMRENEEGNIPLTLAINLYGADDRVVTILIGHYHEENLLRTALEKYIHRISPFFLLAKNDNTPLSRLLEIQEKNEAQKFVRTLHLEDSSSIFNNLRSLLAIVKKIGFSYLDTFISALSNSRRIISNQDLLNKIFDYVIKKACSCINADRFIVGLNNAELLLANQIVLDELFEYMNSSNYYNAFNKASRCIIVFNTTQFLQDKTQRIAKYEQVDKQNDLDPDFYCTQIELTLSLFQQKDLANIVTAFDLSAIASLVFRSRDDYVWAWYKHQIIVPFIYATLISQGNIGVPSENRSTPQESPRETPPSPLITFFTRGNTITRRASFSGDQATNRPRSSSLLLPGELNPSRQNEQKRKAIINGILALIRAEFITTKYIEQILQLMSLAKYPQDIETFIMVINDQLSRKLPEKEKFLKTLLGWLTECIKHDQQSVFSPRTTYSLFTSASEFVKKIERDCVMPVNPDIINFNLVLILFKLMKADRFRDNTYGFAAASLFLDNLRQKTHDAVLTHLLTVESFSNFICKKLENVTLTELSADLGKCLRDFEDNELEDIPLRLSTTRTTKK